MCSLFTVWRCKGLTEPVIFKTTSCWPSASTHATYSQLPSIPAGCLLHPQWEGAFYHGDRDPLNMAGLQTVYLYEIKLHVYQPVKILPFASWSPSLLMDDRSPYGLSWCDCLRHWSHSAAAQPLSWKQIQHHIQHTKLKLQTTVLYGGKGRLNNLIYTSTQMLRHDDKWHDPPDTESK